MMRSIFFLAAVAIHAAAFVSYATADDATAGDAPVTVKVHLDRASYVAGEPILLLLDFQNDSDKGYHRITDDESQKGETGNTDGGTEHDLTAVLKGPGGYVQTWRPRYRPRPQWQYAIPSFPTWAHELTRQTIILSRVFQPSAPGEYQLDWSLNVLLHEHPCRLPRKPEECYRVKAKGTTKFRVVAANREALEKRADALLAEAKTTKDYHVPSLFFLATMPPDIAMPRFRRFFDLKHARKENGEFEYAVHALKYVDTKEAVELIAEVNKWTWHFNNRPPGRFDKGFVTYSESIHALMDMYYTTNKPEIERHIIKKMGGVAPHLLRKPDKHDEPVKKPNIPST